MKKQIQILQVACLALLFMVASCSSPQDLLSTGDYDAAVVQAVKKLRKGKKKRKHVEVVEDAFRKITAKDMATVEALKAEQQAASWVEINEIHRKIQRRQELIEPYLPLYAKDGYKADFKFVRIDPLELDSRKKAADYFYVEANKELEKAKVGNKLAAREAYNLLRNVDRYFDDFRDKDQLKELAVDLGQNKVLFRMENRSNAFLPSNFERELMAISVRDMNTIWTKYFVNPSAVENFDYNIVMNIDEINVSPEQVNERSYVDRKEIEDGFEYVLDSNGNVLKDSLGNDVKVARKVYVFADVIEVYQHKMANVRGHLAFYDNYTKEIVRTERLSVDAVFDNYASTFTGDRRALSNDSRRNLGNRPIPFPTDAALILQAADHLKPAMKSKIERCANIVMR